MLTFDDIFHTQAGPALRQLVLFIPYEFCTPWSKSIQATTKVALQSWWTKLFFRAWIRREVAQYPNQRGEPPDVHICVAEHLWLRPMRVTALVKFCTHLRVMEECVHDSFWPDHALAEPWTLVSFTFDALHCDAASGVSTLRPTCDATFVCADQRTRKIPGLCGLGVHVV